PWVGDEHGITSALDLCTGSGCLAILLALVFPNARVDATELSADALSVAELNIAEYELGDRVHLTRGDLFAGLARRYDLIVSNPPYVNQGAMARLPAEYRAEPAIALAGGQDGLDVRRRPPARAARLVSERGLLRVEMGQRRATL